MIATLFLGLGLFFLFVGGFGLVRLPDFYMRLHPAGKADTLGAALILTGLAVLAGPTLLALKILLVEGFILLANPTATHALARAACKAGLPMWTRKGTMTLKQAEERRARRRRLRQEDREEEEGEA
ncbi:MAG: monovalent cation/H(+) antiporter subunit G [Deltaproteobacteria bacterium]|nr:monovalent cation/H(+) antiporter subunit G [Deltaproteobacteria bacterium]